MILNHPFFSTTREMFCILPLRLVLAIGGLCVTIVGLRYLWSEKESFYCFGILMNFYKGIMSVKSAHAFLVLREMILELFFFILLM